MTDQNSDLEVERKLASVSSSSQPTHDRRRLFRKLLALGGLGITGVLLSQDKTGLLPAVHGTSGGTSGTALIIDGSPPNTGAATTELDSPGNPAFLVTTSTTNAIAVQGTATASGSGVGTGVTGTTFADTGIGVIGNAINASGFASGVGGFSSSTSGVGVQGVVAATSGATYGVIGQTSSTSGIGVSGASEATTGLTYGVLGSTNSSGGVGVAGRNAADGVDVMVAGSGLAGFGVVRSTDPAARPGVWQMYLFAKKNNSYELRVLSPSGHVNKIADLHD